MMQSNGMKEKRERGLVMKKNSKKLGKTSKIQNITLTFPQQQEFFESLKSKVSTDKRVMVAVS